MNPIPDNALPNYDRDEIKDPAAFFRTLFHLRDIKEERAIPAVVTDYDAKTGEVTVIPMAKYTFDTRDGEAEVNRDKIKVRALHICHGGYSISVPILKGDTGWIIAGDRNCKSAIGRNSNIVTNNLTDEELKDKTEKPDDHTLLSFENGFFLPFSWEIEDLDRNPNGNFVIRNARDQLGNKEIENEFGVVRDDLGNVVPSIEELNGKTHSLDGAHAGKYAWSMIEIQRNGMVNVYGQGTKFTVRKEGLYVNDEPYKKKDIKVYDKSGKTVGYIRFCADDDFLVGPGKGIDFYKEDGIFKISAIGGGGAGDDRSCFRIVKNEDDSFRIVDCYYNIGGFTYKAQDFDIGQVVGDQTVIYAKFKFDPNEGQIVTVETCPFDELRGLQDDAYSYIYPLYIMSSGTVQTDLRKALLPQIVETENIH